jgi:hypothetical protein
MSEILDLLKTWETLAAQWEQLSRDLLADRDYWKEKALFYETLIKGEAI